MNIYKPRVARFVRQSRTRNLQVDNQIDNGEEGTVLNSHPVATFRIRAFPDSNTLRGLQIGAPAGNIQSPVYIKVSGTGNRFALVNQSNVETMTVLDNGNVGINTQSPSVSLDINRTDAIILPQGTTAQRPSLPLGGMIRYNTQSGSLEYYNAIIPNWVTVANFIEATGGTVYTIISNGVSYRVHEYNQVGSFSFNVISGSGVVEYLVVGGGGGGADYGGGGAGGYRCSVIGEFSGRGSVAEPLFGVNAGLYNVVVGNGGLGSAGGNDGSNSTFGPITAIGGGGGGSRQNATAGKNGGSGGGGPPNAVNPGSGTVNQGFDGGPGSSDGSQFLAGGGGGAGAVGEIGVISVRAGNGGNGIVSFINGVLAARGGGGGGGAGNSVAGVNGGSGGNGGGGNGAKLNVGGSIGAPNTGGGGGGAGNTGSAGRNGGSGVVIIRYPYPAPFVPITATGGTISVITVSGIPYRVHTFTTAGNFSFVVTSVGTSNGLVEYLVVAGGGGGGGDLAGGGGAGGYRSSELSVVAQNYDVIVGAGGRGGIATATRDTENTRGGDGTNSSFAGIVSNGGGGGGVYGDVSSVLKNGRPGGSGGGAGAPGATPPTSSGGNGGSGTGGQGFAGGLAGRSATNDYQGGGGGGAGGVGQNASTSSAVAGNGGPGVSSNISGTPTTYAGGGGGASYRVGSGGVGGTGGVGGGGNGGTSNGNTVTLSPQNGIENTGGGGGAGAWQGVPTAGGAGGRGIVIIRYALTSI